MKVPTRIFLFVCVLAYLIVGRGWTLGQLTLAFAGALGAATVVSLMIGAVASELGRRAFEKKLRAEEEARRQSNGGP